MSGRSCDKLKSKDDSIVCGGFRKDVKPLDLKKNYTQPKMV